MKRPSLIPAALCGILPTFLNITPTQIVCEDFLRPKSGYECLSPDVNNSMNIFLKLNLRECGARR